MPDDDPYVPLSERLTQDVWHDNFVPKYSAISTAQPTKLLLWGVWMIFAPMALGMIGIGISMAADAPDVITAVVSSILPTLFVVLAVLILLTQTRRYLNASSDAES